MKMKWMKGALLASCLLLSSTLLALRSGDDGVDLKVDFLSNGPFGIVSNRINKGTEKKLRVVVLLRAAEGGGPAALSQLYDLVNRYPDCRFVAVSSDPGKSGDELFAAFAKPNFTTAVDRTLESTRAYMGGSAIFPKAFVIDYRGKIIWDGELADLDQMLSEFYADSFDAARQEKLSVLLSSLQSAMRNGEEAEADRLVREILRLDPGNLAAMRMRLFMLEATRRTADGWKLLEQQRSRSSKSERLYLMQIDYAARYAEYASELPKITVKYLENTRANALNDSALAWSLINQRPFDPVVLKMAGLLLKRAETALPQPESSVQAEVFSASALYHSRIGRLDRSVALQGQATSVLRKHAPNRVAASQSMEKFYAQALEEGKAVK